MNCAIGNGHEDQLKKNLRNKFSRCGRPIYKWAVVVLPSAMIAQKRPRNENPNGS